MAWSAVSAGTGAAADNAAVAPAWPAHSAGDIGIVAAYFRSGPPGSGTLNIGGGSGAYTLLANHPAAANRNIFLWGRVATSNAEAAPTITPSDGSSNDTVLGVINVFAGGTLELSAAAEVSTNTADTSCEFDAYTPLDNDTLVLLLGGWPTASTSDPAAPSGFTAANYFESGVGNAAAIDLSYMIQTTATLVPSGAITLSASTASASIILALKAAAAGGPLSLLSGKLGGLLKGKLG